MGGGRVPPSPCGGCYGPTKFGASAGLWARADISLRRTSKWNTTLCDKGASRSGRAAHKIDGGSLMISPEGDPL